MIRHQRSKNTVANYIEHSAEKAESERARDAAVWRATLLEAW